MSVSFPYLASGYTASSGWRPLRKKDPYLRGWDVYDLQCKLAALGWVLDCDGIFGPQTDAIVRKYQMSAVLVVDGIAGLLTQTTLTAKVISKGELPQRVLGQIEKESSLLCGIYTAPYTDSSRDRGPAQENSNYWPDAEAAFDARRCLPALIDRIKKQHAKYVSWGVADLRAWDAAQGHWNSPTYADRYAKGESVPSAFLAYVAAVTTYAYP